MEKEGDFEWMIKVSRNCDKNIKKIHNCLRNQSLEDLMYDTEKRINGKYQNLYHGITPTRLKSIDESKKKWNIMVTMYNTEWEQQPWYKKLFTKKRKYKSYE